MTPSPTPDAALTAAEVMRALRIGKAALYGLISRRELAAFRVGREYRFNADAVEAFRRGATVEQVRERRRRGKPEWVRQAEQRIK